MRRALRRRDWSWRVPLGAVIATALLAAAGAGTAGAQTVMWPWSHTHIIRAPFNLPFGTVGGVGVSPDGANVYIGSGPVVTQYSATGVWVQTWAARFGHVSGITTDSLGDVYVADSQAGSVEKFDANGKHLASWSVAGVQGIAADAHGHVFLLVSVVLGHVVDVRSDGGIDEGAWSAVLPGTWFITSGYSAATTASIAGIAADAAGNVYLTGTSRQRLEGAGPDCHSIFEVSKNYEFTYDDPLDSGEIAKFSSSGNVLAYGWVNKSIGACYPGWRSSDPLSAADAVSPTDGAVWVSQVTDFLERVVLEGPGLLTRTEELYSPCFSCEGVYEEPAHFLGPATFDCHEDLFSGSDGSVVELDAIPRRECPQRPSQLEQLALAPSVTLVKAPVQKGKKGGKKAKALDFQAGCLEHACTIAATVTEKLPKCHGKHCFKVLAAGHFTLAGGRAYSLALGLFPGVQASLGPRPQILLSARMLLHGRAHGPTFHAGGGRPLLARAAVPLALSCPRTVALGSAINVAGTLGIAGVHSLELHMLMAGGDSSRLLTTTPAGAFSLTVPATAPGVAGFVAGFAGDAGFAPAGAECSTDVPAPPASPAKVLPPPPVLAPPPTEPPPAASALSLSCRTTPIEEFIGILTPALAGVSVTVTYHYTQPGMPTPKELQDVVTTASNGSFHDPGPIAGAFGEATAQWPGGSSYSGASSPTCKFMS